MQKTKPHPINKSDLPTVVNRICVGYTRGREVQRFYRLAGRNVGAGEFIHLLYGNGKAIRIIGKGHDINDRSLINFGWNIQPAELKDGKRYYFLLTDGIDEAAKQKFLLLLPPSFQVSDEMRLLKLGLSPDSYFYRVITLPTTIGFEELPLDKRQLIQRPQIWVGPKPGTSNYKLTSPLDQLEAQAIMGMLGKGGFGRKWQFASYSDSLTPIWENQGFKIQHPLVRVPEAKDIDFKFVDTLLHPANTVASFLNGIIEAVKSI